MENATTTEDSNDAEAQIRSLMARRVEAVRAKDVDGALADHAPNVLTFDVVDPLQYIGTQELRKRLEAWFSSFQGPIGFELRDLSVTAGEDVAFCHSLNGVSGTRTDGGKLAMWFRATVCFRKIGGEWKVTHEHSSAPFDPATGKASLDLEP